MLKIKKAALVETIEALRGDHVVAYDCECCGTGYEWSPDSRSGEYVRWDDLVEVLAKIEEIGV
jgi:hypothetical protein